jgi:hypothetical protein
MLVPLSAGLTLISAFSGETRAALPACEVVLRPADADTAWQNAVSELRSRLREPGATDADCGGIEVHAEGPRTSLTFVTRDGRRAERLVPRPAGLIAIVKALEVTIPESAPAPQEQSESASPLPPKNPAPDRATPAAQEATSAEETKAHFVIDGSSGVRVAGGGVHIRGSDQAEGPFTFGSVSLALGVGASVGPWEFGVLGQYDPAQAQWAGPSPLSGLSMSTFALGVRAGRRQHVGPLDGVVGLTAAIAVTDESQNTPMMTVSTQGAPLSEISRPRVGVFAGLVVPRRARVRVRPEVAFDIVPTLVNSPSSGDGLPLPWWSTSANLGVEWETP